MTITRNRFELALERLKPSDWERFENFASSFLASDYPRLRTLASANGDKGRDAELFFEDNRPKVFFQFSLTDKWKLKVRKTLETIRENYPEVSVLHYATNQRIGANGDEVKAEFEKRGVSLDFLDLSWFLDRIHVGSGRAAVAEELAKAIVDPLLASYNVISQNAVSLTSKEANTALFFLEMQRHDEVAGKNLTRSSFDALVRAALQDSTATARVARPSIYQAVGNFLPQHKIEILKPYVDAALARLRKGAIKHWMKDDTFHISYQEAERLREGKTKLLVLRSSYENDIQEILSTSGGVSVDNRDLFVALIKRVVEGYLFKQGESFASAVSRDVKPEVSDPDLKDIVKQQPDLKNIKGRDPISFVLYVVTTLLTNPSATTLEHLKLLADSYTLFAFLREAPDVQAITKKFFINGTIWLDTSVVLPILAESHPSVEFKPFTSIFTQARNSGVKLHLTPGVLEEIERHLNRSLQYSRSTSWEGMVPYIYSRFILAGGKKLSFSHWLETFMGSYHPERDIAEYLERVGIYVEEASQSSVISQDLTDAVENYWRDVHDKRRSESDYNLVADRLARHDVENTLIVLSSRAEQGDRSALGYSTWWLTLDKAALRMTTELRKSGYQMARHSPVLSLDFLTKYLAFGPSRDLIHDSDKATARVFSSGIFEALPAELLTVAEQVRASCAGLSERVVQRRVRDSLDQARSQIGILHLAGIDNIEQALLTTF